MWSNDPTIEMNTGKEGHFLICMLTQKTNILINVGKIYLQLTSILA